MLVRAVRLMIPRQSSWVPVLVHDYRSGIARICRYELGATRQNNGASRARELTIRCIIFNVSVDLNE